jgi:outer membrane lipoprotein SlyB
MKKIHIIIVLLIILLLIITIRSQSENAGTVNSNSKNLSNEAVQNIASVYANTTGTATFNNLRATGKITGNLDGDVKGNLTGNVIGDVNGDISGNVTGSVIGSVIGQANIRDRQNNNEYLIFVEENTNALSITPRKSDKSDYDWSKRLNIENGNMTINGIINARAIVGGSTTINWNQHSFTEYAATQFRRSDPDGTHKTFIFRKSDSNNVWIISFIKLENFIIGYRHQEHKNFKNGNTEWIREIPFA